MGNKIRKGNVRYIKQSILLNEHYDAEKNFCYSLIAAHYLFLVIADTFG